MLSLTATDRRFCLIRYSGSSSERAWWMSPEAPTLALFWAAFELFRDPIVCALIGGAVLGFLSVYIVLRRMAFVSAAITQTAGLGVALAFYAEIHLGLHIDP